MINVVYDKGEGNGVTIGKDLADQPLRRKHCNDRRYCFRTERSETK